MVFLVGYILSVLCLMCKCTWELWVPPNGFLDWLYRYLLSLSQWCTVQNMYTDYEAKKKKKEALAVKQRGNVFLCIIWMCSSIKQLVWIDGFHLHIKCKSSFSFRWYFFICVVCKYSWHDFSSQMSFSWESVLTVHLCLCMLLVNMSSMTMHQFIQ